MMQWQADQYIDDVLSGRQVACQWVKQACARQRDDLQHGLERGLWFDASAAERVLQFFEGFLKHSKGEWAGKSLKLEPWQQFILWTLFGWKRSDGARRYRTAYIEIARKNGKSLIGSGVGLYLLMVDGEMGAEIYSYATKKDQAKITWLAAAKIARKSKVLSKRLDIFGDKNPKASSCSISMASTGSKFEPLGRDTDSMDGLNVHGAIIDEVHAHKTRDGWDLLDTATGARRQPLLFAVTTAGFDRQTLCWELNDYTKRVLENFSIEGGHRDDSFFGIIFTLDKEDNWQDETCWVKANPNLGVSKKLDDLRRKAQRAKSMPSALNSFLRLELNIWTQAETKWIPWDEWTQCGHAIEWDALRGRKCYSGLDLSSTLDITAHVLVFPPEHDGEKYIVLCRFWIPEDNLRQRVHDDRAPYDAWLRSGWLYSTPGNVIDYDWIFDDIDDDAHEFDLQEVAFDRWGAARVVSTLQNKGLTMVEFGQGFASMSPPMRELERLIRTHDIEHGNNPVLTWMADNLVAIEDPAGNIKPSKEKSREKIDGMVALIMALDRAIRHGGNDNNSVYEERGVRAV
jgi:phage terminase large subunit-like protein